MEGGVFVRGLPFFSPNKRTNFTTMEEDGEGILLFKTSSKQLCHLDDIPRTVQPSSGSRKGQKVVYKAIDASQILFEAKHFLTPTPADVEISLDAEDTRKKARCRRRKRTRSQRNAR